MGGTRVIACALIELYEGAKTFGQLSKLEDEGRYHFPIDACLDAKSVYDSIVHVDLKTPEEKSLMNILGQMREHMHTQAHTCTHSYTRIYSQTHTYASKQTHTQT